ncbi:MAG: class I SAM-dependent methyltransferase [Nitrospirae bacterium]|nr:class I SAM-dependent methyltransferase [Nitrospirota bacterium]MBI3351908.1 class I SAM-dependent methyltransferase [Nitrospirota bacterium]
MTRLETVPCDACGTTNTDDILVQEDLAFPKSGELFHIVECKDCHLRYTNPRPVKEVISEYYFDEYYTLPPPVQINGDQQTTGFRKWSQKIRQNLKIEFYGYPDTGKTKKSWPGSFLKKAFLRLERFRLMIAGREKGIIPYRGEGRVLDIGCGNGSILKGLQKDGWKVYGVEMNHRAAQFAKESLNIDGIPQNLLDAKYPDSFFDVILFNHSLEHMYSPGEILKESERILTDDGLLIISLPNSDSIEAKFFKSYWFPLELPRHLYHFSPKTLEKTLKNNGLRVTKIRGDSGAGTFLLSLDYLYQFKYKKPNRYKRFIKMLVRPFLFTASHLGRSGTITVYAEKMKV